MTSRANGASDDERMRYLAGEPDVEVTDDERVELDDLRLILAERSLWSEPPAELEDAVVDAITTEAASGSSSAPQLAEVGAGPSRRRNRRWVLIAAAAAAVLAVFLTTVILTTTDNAQRYSVALGGTELAPDIDGTADLTKTDSGWEVQLEVGGLPRLDGDRYYQAWLRNAAGVSVPIGTFNEGTDVVLWAGVSPKEYGTMTVTQEVADGDQASSGRVVLTGTAVLQS